MDFSALNKVGATDWLPKKSLSELTVDEIYAVTQLKQVTTKYGRKVVAELRTEFQIFLPTRICEAILKNKKFFEEMIEAADDRKLTLTYLGGSKLEFSSVGE